MCTWCVCSRVNVTLSPECVIVSVRLHSVILALTGGLKRPSDPLLPLSLSPSGQRPAGPIDSLNEEVFRSSVCSPLFSPHVPGLTLKLKVLPIVFCALIDLVGVQGGPSFQITDNNKGPVLTVPCQYKFPLLISNFRKTGQLYKTSVKQETLTITS